MSAEGAPEIFPRTAARPMASVRSRAEGDKELALVELKAMKAKRLGVIVIGQSPRPDVVAQIRKIAGENCDIELRGALDGMSRAEIDGTGLADGFDVLFTRLSDGAAIKIAKGAVERGAKSAIGNFLADGVAFVMLFCTNDFPSLAAEHPGVLLPANILANLVRGLPSNARLGLFVPLAEHVGRRDSRWPGDRLQIKSVPLAPGSSESGVDEAAAQMSAFSPDFVVMDCMSYTPAMKERVQRTLRAPAILGIEAAARLLRQSVA